MATAILKTCATCRQSKQTTEFNVHKRRPDGLRSVCRVCQKAENRASYLKDQEAQKARCRANMVEWRKVPANAEKNRRVASEWYYANLDAARRRSRQWAEDNSEQKSKTYRLWAKANPAKVRDLRISWRAANANRKRDNDLRWARENRHKLRAKDKAYREAFPDKHAARQGRRRATKLQATPAWANSFFIEEAYHLAKLRTKITGFEWHVDHVVPLKGKTVCGLHVESNLAVIPGIENNSKSNRYWPDMP